LFSLVFSIVVLCVFRPLLFLCLLLCDYDDDDLRERAFRSPCECIKSLQRRVLCAFRASRSCLLPPFVAFSNGRSVSLIYPRFRRIENLRESRAHQNVFLFGRFSLSLSLSPTNPIHGEGKSKSEETSRQKHDGDTERSKLSL
jgi:hypothetical protein